ncbi:MAG: hypothetical protein LBI43_00480 [Streptococcaceae bacterium]|jgi:hypothetical protein|nr:hypothetical protein [Streptococcaceae bacterium]
MSKSRLGAILYTVFFILAALSSYILKISWLGNYGAALATGMTLGSLVALILVWIITSHAGKWVIVNLIAGIIILIQGLASIPLGTWISTILLILSGIFIILGRKGE